MGMQTPSSYGCSRPTLPETNPLQTWEQSDGSALAQVTGDGRLELGDLDLGTPDALIEANRDITLPSSVPGSVGYSRAGDLGCD